MDAAEIRKPYSRGSARSGIETRLSLLQKRYRTALSGAVVAKAHYLAQAGNNFANPAMLERARWKWERIEARRRQLRAELEDLQRKHAAVELPGQTIRPATAKDSRARKARPNSTLKLAL